MFDPTLGNTTPPPTLRTTIVFQKPNTAINLSIIIPCCPGITRFGGSLELGLSEWSVGVQFSSLDYVNLNKTRRQLRKNRTLPHKTPHKIQPAALKCSTNSNSKQTTMRTPTSITTDRAENYTPTRNTNYKHHHIITKRMCI